MRGWVLRPCGIFSLFQRERERERERVCERERETERTKQTDRQIDIKSTGSTFMYLSLAWRVKEREREGETSRERERVTDRETDSKSTVITWCFAIFCHTLLYDRLLHNCLFMVVLRLRTVSIDVSIHQSDPFSSRVHPCFGFLSMFYTYMWRHGRNLPLLFDKRFNVCFETFHSRPLSRWAALFEGCAASQRTAVWRTPPTLTTHTCAVSTCTQDSGV